VEAKSLTPIPKKDMKSLTKKLKITPKAEAKPASKLVLKVIKTP
jgi:hypothetical protein